MTPRRRSLPVADSSADLLALSPPGEPSWRPGPTRRRITIEGKVKSTRLARALAEDVLQTVDTFDVPCGLQIVGRTVTVSLARPKEGEQGERTRRAALELADLIQFSVRPWKP